MSILIANWKMNPGTEAEAKAMAKYSDQEGVVVCGPLVFLALLKKTLKRAAIGAQDVFWVNGRGPYTGAVSASQLKDLGVEYVIIGHSDQRRYFKETDGEVAKKAAAVIEAGLVPVLCLGETREEREAGQTQEVVDRQLKAVLSQLPEVKKKARLIVCYEPVWAISGNAAGAGLAELAVSQAPEVAVEMIRYMKRVSESFNVDLNFIYGGSAGAENIDALLKQEEIEGFLVGAASLSKRDFEYMVAACRKR